MEKRKQISFDIDTNVTKEILGESKYTSIYSNIQSFMRKEGWEHIEGSVYMSTEPLSNTKVSMLIDRLKKEYPYITKCVRDMHQADISKVHSLEAQFEYDGTPGKFAQKENGKSDKQAAKEPMRKASLRDVLAQKKEAVHQHRTVKDLNEHKKSHDQEL